MILQLSINIMYFINLVLFLKPFILVLFIYYLLKKLIDYAKME